MTYIYLLPPLLFMNSLLMVILGRLFLNLPHDKNSFLPLNQSILFLISNIFLTHHLYSSFFIFKISYIGKTTNTIFVLKCIEIISLRRGGEFRNYNLFFRSKNYHGSFKLRDFFISCFRKRFTILF